MSTTYVVLQETDCSDYDEPVYTIVGRTEASTAAQARRAVAETLPPDLVDTGVDLRAVPARNWDGGKGREQAETTRRIRST